MLPLLAMNLCLAALTAPPDARTPAIRLHLDRVACSDEGAAPLELATAPGAQPGSLARAEVAPRRGRAVMAVALVATDLAFAVALVESIPEGLAGRDTPFLLSFGGLLFMPPAAAALVANAPGRGAAYFVGLGMHTAAVLAMFVAPPAGLVLGLALDAWATTSVMARELDVAARREALPVDVPVALTAIPVRDPAAR